jgi:hypothetical protein
LAFIMESAGTVRISRSRCNTLEISAQDRA